MTKEQVLEEIKKITDRIIVLEAEKTAEKYMRSLYSERQMLLHKLAEFK
jgi:hypothetical protein